MRRLVASRQARAPPSGGVEHFAGVPSYRLKKKMKATHSLTHTHKKKEKKSQMPLSLSRTRCRDADVAGGNIEDFSGLLIGRRVAPPRLSWIPDGNQKSSQSLSLLAGVDPVDSVS